ncbi:MAG: M23 family metallopeptidase, partial [Angelakisella sp.]
ENNRKIVEQNVSGVEEPWQEEVPSEIPSPASEAEKMLPNVEKPRQSPTSQSASSSPAISAEQQETQSEQLKPEQRLEQSPYTLPMSPLAVIAPYSKGELVKNKTLNVWRTHDAVDLKGEKNSNVTAVSDGVIVAVGVDPLWGGFIEMKHPDGCSSSYSGVTAEKSLKKGVNVKGGQKLGTLSDIPAEISMEPHLHFSIKKNGVFLDPGLYLKLQE